jgi:hypothetical protein
MVAMVLGPGANEAPLHVAAGSPAVASDAVALEDVALTSAHCSSLPNVVQVAEPMSKSKSMYQNLNWKLAWNCKQKPNWTLNRSR